jgi:ABC-type nitrate/sulfonate/bicarbonate transport system substrate-binding protein
MQRCENFWIFGLILSLLHLLAESSLAQEKRLERFFLSNSTLSESRAQIYIAQDLKLFEKFGLDAQVVNIRGSAINNASLMAGEIQMAVANGTIAVTAAARGAPIVIVATAGPTRYSLVSRTLTAPPQLKGKVIGIGGYGIGDYFVIKRLLPKLGFNAEKDVTLLPTGTTSSFERINMMLSGKADAVLASKSNIDRVELRGVKLNLLAGGLPESMERMVWNLSFDPDEPDHLYAGTGEAQGQRSENVSSRGAVLLSKNRGDSWQEIYQSGNTIRSVAVGMG